MWNLDPFHNHRRREYGEPDQEAMYSNPFATGFNLASAARYYNFQAGIDNAEAAGQIVVVRPDYQYEARSRAAAKTATRSATTASPSPTALPSPPKDISSAIVITGIESPGSRNADTGAEPIYEGEGIHGHITGYAVTRPDGWTAVYNANGQLTRTVLTLQSGAVYFNAKGEQQGSRVNAGDRHGWYDSSGKFFGQTAVDSGTQGVNYLRSPVDQGLREASRKYEGALAGDPNPFTPNVVTDLPAGGVSIQVPDGSPKGWRYVEPTVSDGVLDYSYKPDPKPQSQSLVYRSSLMDLANDRQRADDEAGRRDFQDAQAAASASNGRVLQSALDYLANWAPSAQPPNPALVPMAFPTPAPAAAPPAPANTGSQGTPRPSPSDPRRDANPAYYSYGGAFFGGGRVSDDTRDARLEQISIGSLNPSDRALARSMLGMLNPDEDMPNPNRGQAPGQGQELSSSDDFHNSSTHNQWHAADFWFSETPGDDFIHGDGTAKEKSHMAAWRRLHPDNSISYNVRMENEFMLMVVESAVLAGAAELAEASSLRSLGLEASRADAKVINYSLRGRSNSGAKLYPKSEIPKLREALAARGIELKVGTKHLPEGMAGSFNAQDGVLALMDSPTLHDVMHELAHLQQCEQLGVSTYRSLTPLAREQYAFDAVQNNSALWEGLTDKERELAVWYIETKMGGTR